MFQSTEIDKISAALAKAQGSLPKLISDKKFSAHGKPSKYASLKSARDCVQKTLMDNQLSITTTPDLLENGTWILRHVLRHSSGQWIGCIGPYIQSDTDNKIGGSSITYQMRYLLQGFFGLAPNEGEENEMDEIIEQQKPQNTLSLEQQLTITDLVGNNEWILNKIFATLKVQNITKIKDSDYLSVLQFIKKSMEEK